MVLGVGGWGGCGLVGLDCLVVVAEVVVAEVVASLVSLSARPSPVSFVLLAIVVLVGLGFLHHRVVCVQMGGTQLLDNSRSCIHSGLKRTFNPTAGP